MIVYDLWFPILIVWILLYFGSIIHICSNRSTSVLTWAFKFGFIHTISDFSYILLWFLIVLSLGHGIIFSVYMSKSNDYPSKSIFILIKGVSIKEEVAWCLGKMMAYILKADWIELFPLSLHLGQSSNSLWEQQSFSCQI